jgi:serine/threonine protein kinase
MLELNPDKRITAKEALSHEWFEKMPKMSEPKE